jgi:hypothetical protein
VEQRSGTQGLGVALFTVEVVSREKKWGPVDGARGIKEREPDDVGATRGGGRWPVGRTSHEVGEAQGGSPDAWAAMGRLLWAGPQGTILFFYLFKIIQTSFN